jgi:hypothetical protein
VGRELSAGPDYIYTVNLLYQMGILPTVDYIPLEKSIKYRSFDEAVAGYSWMFHGLDQDEEELLKKYVRSISSTGRDGTVTVHRRVVPIWAYISWTPTDLDKT